jgi:hypothetical protein
LTTWRGPKSRLKDDLDRTATATATRSYPLPAGAPVRLRLCPHMASTITPWFCVKSALLGHVRPAPESQKKVFLNVCTQSSVPKPPEIPDSGFHDRLESPSESDRYLIPTVLAEPREDVDKCASKSIHPTYCCFQLTSLHSLNPHLR